MEKKREERDERKQKQRGKINKQKIQEKIKPI